MQRMPGYGWLGSVLSIAVFACFSQCKFSLHRIQVQVKVEACDVCGHLHKSKTAVYAVMVAIPKIESQK